MVKKGGKLPEGHINDWFWEKKDMKDYIASRLPAGLLTCSICSLWLSYLLQQNVVLSAVFNEDC